MSLEDVVIYHIVDKNKSSVVKICHCAPNATTIEVAFRAYTLMPNSQLVQFWRQSDERAIDVPLVLSHLVKTFDDKVLISFHDERTTHMRLKQGNSFREIEETISNLLAALNLSFVHRKIR